MQLWTGAIVKLKDGTLGQVKECDSELITGVTADGDVFSSHASQLELASFDEMGKFREAIGRGPRPLVGQKSFEM